MTQSTARTDSYASPDTLRDYLRGREVPCPQCGYNLRDLQGPRCPECGSEIVIRLALAEPSAKLWIAGLVGLCLGTGFHGLLSLLLIILRLTTGNGPPWNDPAFKLIIAAALVQGVALALWLYYSKRIRRAPKQIRLVLMLLCWVSTVVLLSLFVRAIH